MEIKREVKVGDWLLALTNSIDSYDYASWSINTIYEIKSLDEDKKYFRIISDNVELINLGFFRVFGPNPDFKILEGNKETLKVLYGKK